MSYQVLARKWRPRSFSEMIGQEHVVRALVNALDHDRLHHAYLFTGTRGVGKTTVARIFAKALNCEQGVGSSPCGVCSSCRELDEGRFVDLIEVDAASRTKVEDTRDLLDYVQYAPTRGRYKVYLIDEVHMLSRHSFNALLKTLEEPPPHIKFLLATTDPQRLPVTILSRCLQFNLRRMPEELIGQHLARVLTEESIPADAAAIAHIARAADGSVRDALSLLDQAIAYGGGRLGDAEVRAMLGTIDRAHVYDLLDALAAGDGAALLDGVQRAAEYTVEFSDLLGEMLSALQRIAVAQLVPQANAEEGDADAARIAALAGTLGREDVQLYYQIALIGRRDLPYSPDARTGVEMVLLRMLAFRPGDDRAERPAAPAAHPAGTAARTPQATAPAPAARGAPVPQPPVSEAARPRAAVAPPPTTPAPASERRETAPAPAVAAVVGDKDEWETQVARLDLQGMAAQLAANCVLLERQDGRLRLLLDRNHKHLHSAATEERLQQALQAECGGKVAIDIAVGEVQTAATPAARSRLREQQRREEAIAALEGDAGVRAFQDVFNARIIPETVQPID